MSTAPNKRPPFVGHLPFHHLDQALFFGRDAEIGEAQLLIKSHRLLLLSGPAGVGKTSFLNAGLIPALEDEGFEVFPPVIVGKQAEHARIDGSSNVFIFNVLSQWAKDEKTNRTQLTQETLAVFLEQGQSATEKNRPPQLLVFENLETLFTQYPEHQKDREDFFHQVREALTVNPQLRIIFVMRQANLHQLAAYADLLPGKLQTQLQLKALSTHAALSAITFPLENRHVAFEKGVAETLVKDLAMLTEKTTTGENKSMPGTWVEPSLLQIVCERLWHDMPHDAAVITKNHRSAFADVDHALSLFYERSLQGIASETGVSEEGLRTWFEQELITTSGTRSRVARGEKETEENIAVLEALESFHLIRSDFQDQTQWYTLSHDRLIRPVINANHDWRSRKEEEQRTHRHLENQAIEWVRLGRKETLLLKGEALVEAERWLQQADIARHGGSEILKAFVRASLEKPDETQVEAIRKNEVRIDAQVKKESADLAFERAEKETRLTKRLSRRTQTMVFVFVIAAIAAIIAGLQWQSAQKAKALAKTEFQRAQAQTQLALNRAEEAETALKAAEASRVETEQAKSEALAARQKADQERKRAEAQAALAATRAQEALASAEEALSSKKQAEAAKTAAIAAQKKVAKQSREAQSFLSHSLTVDAVNHVKTNPILSVLLAMQALSIADFAKKTDIAEAEDVLYQAMHTLPLKSVLSVHADRVNAVVFGRGGKRLASAGEEGIAKIWHTESGNELRIFAHDSPITSLAYRGNGRQLATAGLDGQIKVWKIASGKQLFTLSHKAGAVNSVAFSPNEKYIASAGENGIAIIWEVRSEKQRNKLRGHQSAIHQIVFSPNSKNLATAGEDGTVRIWDVKSGKTRLKLSGHEQAVTDVAFSPDGKQIASASKDGTARIWDAGFFGQGEVKFVLAAHTGEVLSLAFSPDGRRIATASNDGTVRLWNANNGEELAILTGHRDAVTSLAFSPDGRVLATAGQDKTLRLYSLEIKDMMALVRKQSRRSLTQEECRKYLHTAKCPPKA